MNLTKVLAISGKPGLYHLETQTRSGFLATSLADGKRISVGIRNNVSLLSEIAIYTFEKEVPLTEVFTTLKKEKKRVSLQNPMELLSKSISLKYSLITTATVCMPAILRK